jgi:drug/metabolite transporter (DMT)-like permease
VAFGIACSISYGIFIVVYRAGGKDDRRIAGPLFDATLFGGLGTLVFGPFVDSDFHLLPNLQSHVYLAILGNLCQVLGWLIISIALPRLPAALTALILLIQPLGGIGIAVLFLGEHPTLIQLLGGTVILAGVVYASRAPRAPLSTG